MAVKTRTRRIRMTWEEFVRLPEGPPYYDYVNGEAVEVNRPTGKHQQIELRLGNVLWEHVRARDLGEIFPQIDVALPTGNAFGPDITFVSKEHLHWYGTVKGDLYGTPDLVVEISSASTAAYDRGEKLDSYRDAGVPWVWFVDQETLEVEEYRWTGEGYVTVSATPAGETFRPQLFPGLEINLKALIGL